MRTFSYPAGVYNTTPGRVVFGPGSVRGIAGELARLDAKRVLVITTPGRIRLGEQLLDLIGGRVDLTGGRAALMSEAVSQVPIELAQRGRERARSAGADCLVCAGGGAATGLAKAIALELSLPVVAVPTTYSGSEMTGFCGITIDGIKRMHASRRMLPSTVIYDAELTLSLPRQVTAASAINALAHCIDAIYLPTLSPLLAPAAAEGAGIVAETLPRVLADPSRVDARNELLYGAYLAGAVLTGGFALQHGIAHTLGGSFGVEHGLAHALVLPQVTSYLERHVPGALKPIAQAFRTGNLGGAIYDLLASSGLPTRLSEVGITPSDLEQAIKITVDTDSGHTANPVPVTHAAVSDILRGAYAGERPR